MGERKQDTKSRELENAPFKCYTRYPTISAVESHIKKKHKVCSLAAHLVAAPLILGKVQTVLGREELLIHSTQSAVRPLVEPQKIIGKWSRSQTERSVQTPRKHVEKMTQLQASGAGKHKLRLCTMKMLEAHELQLETASSSF